MTEGHSRIQSMILGGSEAVAGKDGRRETGPCRCISPFGLVGDGNGQRQMERDRRRQGGVWSGQAVREKQE